MLLRFQFSNFRSFRAEQEFSMIADSLSDMPEIVISPNAISEQVLPVAAIFGANASGKTNVLKALYYMGGAVVLSHRTWEPDAPIQLQPFRLDSRTKSSPSEFVVDIIVDGVRYEYGFVATPKEFEKEWLNAYPSGRRQKLFSRQSGKAMYFSRKLQGENVRTEKITRPNSLFLSAAAQNNHPALTPIYRWFADTLDFVTSSRNISETAQLLNDEHSNKVIPEFLRAADLGIIGVQLKRGKKPTDDPKLKRMADAMVSALEISGDEAEEFRKFMSSEHPEIEVIHSDKSTGTAFSLANESDGTVAYLALLGPVVLALRNGGVVCIDELDSNLHPLLAREIVRVFQDPKLNPKRAQLIFNSHNLYLLSDRSLRRDQVWLTEKDRDGASHLYPLTQFKPRKDENLNNGYVQGRYGAIPFVDYSALSGLIGKYAETK